MEIVKLSPHGNALRLTVPVAYLAKLRWHKGDHLHLDIADGHLIVRSLNPHNTAMRARGNKAKGAVERTHLIE
jgi:antitoxin component of MazEF toxin-antitoxin module